MMGWQPIETAPRDGTTIRLKLDETETHGFFKKGGTWGFADGFMSLDEETTFSPDWCGRRDLQPTHWMPLTFESTQSAQAAKAPDSSGS